MNVKPNVLLKRWVHSHEEDTDKEMVFRTEQFPFPRSRGRFAFELKPDHSLVESGIGPADVPQISTGKWELSADGKLMLFKNSEKAPSRVMKIASADENRLVIQK